MLRNKLILGTVQFGLDYGINNNHGKPSLKNIFQIFDHAFDNGIFFLDTAEIYGDVHKIIGNYHLKNPDKKFRINTKFNNDLESSQINDKIINFLNNLNIDFIETLMFHSFNSYKNNINGIKYIQDFKKKGIIKKIGVSVYNNNEIEYLLNDNRIDTIQLPFNLFDNLNKRGFYLNKLKSFNKEIHTRSTFLQGLFFMDFDTSNSLLKILEKELNFIKEISIKNDISINDLALLYCLSQTEIDQVIIGVDSLNQLKKNLSCIKKSLNNKLLNDINNIDILNNDVLNPSLWEKI